MSNKPQIDDKMINIAGLNESELDIAMIKKQEKIARQAINKIESYIKKTAGNYNIHRASEDVLESLAQFRKIAKLPM